MSTIKGAHELPEPAEDCASRTAPTLPWIWPEEARILLGVLAIGLSIGLMAGGGHRPRERGTVPVLGASTWKLDPNEATAQALEGLPRIGPTLARRIVDARADGRFRSAEDLRDRVRGIGPATLARIAPYLQFDDQGLPSPRLDATPRTVIVDVREKAGTRTARKPSRSRRPSVQVAAKDGLPGGSASP